MYRPLTRWQGGKGVCAKLHLFPDCAPNLSGRAMVKHRIRSPRFTTGALMPGPISMGVCDFHQSVKAATIPPMAGAQARNQQLETTATKRVLDTSTHDGRLNTWGCAETGAPRPALVRRPWRSPFWAPAPKHVPTLVEGLPSRTNPAQDWKLGQHPRSTSDGTLSAPTLPSRNTVSLLLTRRASMSVAAAGSNQLRSCGKGRRQPLDSAVP